MKLSFGVLISVLLLSSCSIQKMRYSKGLNISLNRVEHEAPFSAHASPLKSKNLPISKPRVRIRSHPLALVSIQAVIPHEVMKLKDCTSKQSAPVNSKSFIKKKVQLSAVEPVTDEEPIFQENSFSFFSRLLVIASVVSLVIMLLTDAGGWFVPALFGVLGVLFGLIGLLIKYFRNERLKLKDFLFLFMVPVIILGIALYLQTFIKY